MFIALDESIGEKFVSIGCLCLPLNEVAELERKFITKRIEFKCWGELDWDSLSNQYLQKYIEFLKEYLTPKNVTFHSWVYPKPSSKEIDLYYQGNTDKVLYMQEFILLKNVLRKCVNCNYKNVYILLDNRDNVNKEYALTKKYLNESTEIYPKPNINFFQAVDSKICGAMQIASICTSAVRQNYDDKSMDSRNCDIIVDELIKLNNGIDIVFNPKHLSPMFRYKFHHGLFDPAFKKSLQYLREVQKFHFNR